jgi:hypothetical protein
MSNHESQRLVEEFLQNGGQIQRLPTRAPTTGASAYHRMKEIRKETPERPHIDPHEETRRLAKVAAERERILEEYRIKKMRDPSTPKPVFD